MRRADEIGIVFGFRAGWQEISVLKPDPRIELKAKRFAIERPHRVFISVEHARQADVGPVQDFDDLTGGLRAYRKFLLVDFDQHTKEVAGVGKSHELFGRLEASDGLRGTPKSNVRRPMGPVKPDGCARRGLKIPPDYCPEGVRRPCQASRT
jgi:hypothetical protein